MKLSFVLLVIFILSFNSFASDKQIVFKWGVFRVTEDKKVEVIDVDDNPFLNKNDRFRVYFEPVKNAYIYLYMLDSAGDLFNIFPDDFNLFDDNYAESKGFMLPDYSSSYGFDPGSGEEKFYLVVSNNRLKELEIVTRKYTNVFNNNSSSNKVRKYKMEILKEITSLIRKNTGEIVSIAEKPMPIAGGIKAIGGDSVIVTEISAESFYSKTFKINH